MKKCMILLCAVLFTNSVYAEQKSSKASVEKLMELTEVANMVDTMHGQIGNMLNGMAKQMGITEQERPAFDRYMKKVLLLLEQELTWDTMKEPMMAIYTQHFTEEEIVGLIEFYQSDLGKSLTKKMPLVMQDSMMMSQQLLRGFMPKVQALAQEMQEEIQQSRQSN